MSCLRVSAISYLNTAPLMWSFENPPRNAALRERFQIDYTIPSRCAHMLAEGSADIGIIPVAAYATTPNLIILPDVAIASKNAVRSILLISKKPLDQIRTVALDSSSRSSAALIQILFARHWNLDVQFAPAAPQIDEMLAQNDAALLIGDPALEIDRTRYITWDVAEEWLAFCGKPFVFAFWAVRAGAADEATFAEIAQTFRSSRDEGLEHLDEIAADWSSRLTLSRDEITSYLSRNIHYFLDQENTNSMRLFFRYAAELKILPSAPELRFATEQLCRNSVLAKSF